jgi:UDP-2,4-diacetamido-2,4,6-trideoxy-beta-L-altropyranose hydrolase
MIEYTFRQAKLSDMDDLYRLSNEKLVRSNSIHPEDIIYEDHVNWLHKVLSDEKYLILVVEEEGFFVGQVKFKIDNTNAIISLSLNASHRGKGTGSMIISDSVEYLINMRKEMSDIIAYIKNVNIASIRSFEKAGFVNMGLEEVNGITLSRYAKNIDRGKV